MSQIDIAKYEAIVSSPGKFEGEQAFVPYFWELAMDGEDSVEYDGDTPLSVFSPQSFEIQAFNLPTDCVLILWETGQGFVSPRVFENPEDWYEVQENRQCEVW